MSRNSESRFNNKSSLSTARTLRLELLEPRLCMTHSGFFDACTGLVHPPAPTTEGSQVDVGGGFVAFVVSEAAQRRDLNGDHDRFDDVLHVLNAATGEVRNSRQHVVGNTITALGGGLVALATSEAAQQRDLNGDRDRVDEVLQVFDFVAGIVRNSGQQIIGAASPRLQTGIVSRGVEPPSPVAVGPRIVPLGGGLMAFITFEGAQRRELNRDSDRADSVLQVFNGITGAVLNSAQQAVSGSLTALGGGLVGFVTSEFSHNRDLNRDGDRSDTVLQTFNGGTGEVKNSTEHALSDSLVCLGGGLVAFLTSEANQNRDLNRDGDRSDTVLEVFDTVPGVVRNSGQHALAGTLTDLGGGFLSFLTSEASQNRDLNRDGDRFDLVLHSIDALTGVVTNSGEAV